MNWSRAKTILIILFLALDVFLLCTLMQTRSVSMKIPEDIIQKTTHILQTNNIEIKPSTIPVVRGINRNIIMKNYFEEPELKASLMLTQTMESVLFDAEDHEYKFQNEKAVLHIKGTEFSYYLKTPSHTTTAPENTHSKNVVEVIQNLLYDLGFEKKSFELKLVSVDDGLYTCEAVPLYQSQKVYGMHMHITATLDEIVNLSGTWFEAKATEEFTDEKLLDVTTVLLDLMYTPEFAGIQIEKIELGYLAIEEYLSSREISAIPVYCIKHSENQVYYADARTGELLS